ncbi:hypothetical protein AWC22_24770 [Mycobacterium riyadhense]|uniref:Uncharacterized protein n=1 Tax=Mycobacterium riyadhense TaxID=486698 RepID=A0A1X2C5W3_9MYCO|nr:hypothetical protein AWC22_24770 [Mycobacterium riyadhense]
MAAEHRRRYPRKPLLLALLWVPGLFGKVAIGIGSAPTAAFSPRIRVNTMNGAAFWRQSLTPSVNAT